MKILMKNKNFTFSIVLIRLLKPFCLLTSIKSLQFYKPPKNTNFIVNKNSKIISTTQTHIKKEQTKHERFIITGHHDDKRPKKKNTKKKYKCKIQVQKYIIPLSSSSFLPYLYIVYKCNINNSSLLLYTCVSSFFCSLYFSMV